MGTWLYASLAGGLMLPAGLMLPIVHDPASTDHDVLPPGTARLVIQPVSPGRPTVDHASGLSMVTVGWPGNPADTNGLGAVAVPFRIGTFEVTNAQYVEFLSAVASADPLGLYHPLMTSSDRGGIERTGAAGNWSYSTKIDFDQKPVNATTWVDAARFCNWLHNGKPVGDQGPKTTEDGAYDLSQPLAAITRRPGALYFLPSHDEWYKAAYYDPFLPGADAGGTSDYWFYPTRSDSVPVEAMADSQGDVTNPGPNVANACRGAVWNGESGNVTSVGGCRAPSPWGAFDLGGNINEVTETPGTPIDANTPTRRLRGGDFANTITLLGSPAFLAGSLNMQAEGANIGFRVAAPAAVPFPFGSSSASPGPSTITTNLVLRLEGTRPNVPVWVGAAPLGSAGAFGSEVPVFVGHTDESGTLELPLPLRFAACGDTLEFRARLLGRWRREPPTRLSITLP